MTITQVITPFSGDVPDKGTMTPDEFDVAAQAWVDYQEGLAAEINTWAEEVNATATSENAAAATLAAANFAGLWENLTGALSVPASVYYNGYFWMLLEDTLDITEDWPNPENPHWAIIRLDSRVIFGTEITASRELTAADANKYFEVNSATGATLTLPNMTFATGDTFIFEQTGIGKIIIAAAPKSGVTVNGGAQSIKQYTALQLVAKSPGLFTVIGGQEV